MTVPLDLRADPSGITIAMNDDLFADETHLDHILLSLEPQV